MPIEIFNCEQSTPEWFACRAGIPTASCFATVMANGKGGGPSLTRAKYMRTLAGEVLTGECAPEGYSNAAMERGKVMEAEARDWYALVHGHNDMQAVGFVRNGRKGCSPDHLIGATGGLEIKTKIPDLLIECHLRKDDAMPPEHMAQVQGCLWVCEREWWDFVAYWPKMPPFVRRVHRDEAYIMRLASEVKRFTDELDELVEKMRRLM